VSGLSLRAAIVSARQSLRSRRGRALGTGAGIALAAAMLAAAVVVAFGLGTGFSRAARAAGLPTVIVRFDREPASTVASRVRALPDVARYALRLEVNEVSLRYGSHSTNAGTAEVLDSPGRHEGYAIIAGRNLGRRGSGVLVEEGLAEAWGIHVGARLRVGGLGWERVVGLAEGPDDVGYPLAAPRIYLSRPALDAQYGVRERDPEVDLADIWLRAPQYVNEVLTQARASSFGIKGIQFVTSEGIRILLDQAAGIVIDLLVALSLMALVTAGVLLGASARAEVARRLRGIGVRRAIGESQAQVGLAQGVEGLMVAVPAGTVGVLAGTLAMYQPTARLLVLLNEPAPGFSLWLPVAATWAAAILVPALGAAWPAWRAGGRSVVGLLRGGEAADTDARRRLPGARFHSGLRAISGSLRAAGGSGLAALGARLAAARRARLLATVVMLGISCGFALLMLALAAELSTLETDPGALGKRYQLTAQLPASAAREVSRIPGVAAVAPRYSLVAADSFELGETIDVIAYPGNHTIFEAPPLISGRRLRGGDQTEVGAGLADALGLTEGSVLALQLPNGTEARFLVSGIVSSLQDDGRVAYVPASGLLRAYPAAAEQLAVVLTPGADVGAVDAALARLGGEPASAGGATARGAPLVDVLRAILRLVAIVDGLVCLYALIQACALTVFERRRTLAVLRASGAGAGAIARLLGGAVAVIVVPAAIAGVALERLVLGPALSHLAEGYATLPLAAGPGPVLAVLAGLVLAGAVAVGWVTAATTRRPVVEGLAG
jgi:ABC-type lipoprotein release transport system permease subunit